MKLYELLEPVIDANLFIDTENAFKSLNELLGTEFSPSKSEKLIIEIFGTSAVGKTTFKNMIINCLKANKNITLFKDERTNRECPNHLDANYFSNFKGEGNNAIIFEHSFNLNPDPLKLKSKLEEFWKITKDKEYVYIFFDEFEYYFLFREKKKKNGKIKSYVEPDLELFNSFYTEATKEKNLIVFVFTPVYFLLKSNKRTLRDNIKDEIKERLMLLRNRYYLNIGEGFSFFIFELSSKYYNFNLDIVFDTYYKELDDEIKNKIKAIYGDEKILKEFYKELAKSLFNLELENAPQKIPIYYLKYLIYYILVDYVLSNNPVPMNIEIVEDELSDIISRAIKSRRRLHIRHLVGHIIDKIVINNKNELKRKKEWNIFKKVSERGMVNKRFHQDIYILLEKLTQKSVMIKRFIK